MRIILVRHGDAINENINPLRPLSDLGQQQAHSVAKQLLAQVEFHPQVIMHSGKARAKETAEQIIQQTNFSPILQEEACLKPGGDPEDVITLIEALGQDCMMVSHLPLLDYLLADLLLGVPNQQMVEFHPCTAVGLHLQPNKEWRIEWIIRP